MSDAPHTTHEHHDGPPTLPEIVDEAGDTPTWVPILGIALFALIAVMFVAREQMKTDVPAPVAAPAADAPAEPAPTE
jgi:hypothetical protein